MTTPLGSQRGDVFSEQKQDAHTFTTQAQESLVPGDRAPSSGDAQVSRREAPTTCAVPPSQGPALVHAPRARPTSPRACLSVLLFSEPGGACRPRELREQSLPPSRTVSPEPRAGRPAPTRV